MNLDDALAWLYSTQLHGIQPGLECMRRLVRELELATGGGKDEPRFIHVAGTNGKGSVCAMLDSILRASGRHTGLFTSPHLISFRERIQIDGAQIPEETLAQALTRIRDLTVEWERKPTFFEIATVVALMHFHEQRVEYAIMETGLGGRLDATNVVTPVISVLTPIDLDHQQYLGRRPAEIAMEKAGIIKPGVPAISGAQQEEVLQVLAQVACERDAKFHYVISPLAGAILSLSGEYQRWNAALAVHALDAAGIPVSNEALVRGLATVRWPGRFQQLDGGRVVLDGAHNLSAARQLTRTWCELYPSEEATILFTVMQDKDLRGICASLAPIAARFIVVPLENARSTPAETIVDAIMELAPRCETIVAEDLDEALEIGYEYPERLLVAGSLYLVGEALALLQGRSDFERSSQ